MFSDQSGADHTSALATAAARRDIAFVSVDKVLQEKWYVAPLEIAATAQFVRHVGRYILRPFLGGVETDPPDRVVMLTIEQVSDHRFQIGGLDIGFPISAAFATEVVHRKINVLVVALRHD